jgi:8-oxo-dGTP diphosphatase
MTQQTLIRAAGGVLWQPADLGVWIAVVHRPRYDDWSLPKGKLDPGEHPLEAAVREVCEETGFPGTVGRRLAAVGYQSLAGPKTVDYWAMRAGEGTFVPGDEVDGLEWLATDDALRRLTYGHDAEVVGDFARLTADTLVLLVRHAKAGDRGSWPHADELRPLDPVGVRQAARLAEVLPLFGPHRIVAADRARCILTVEPLARRLGLAVELEPGLSEEGYAMDSTLGMRRIRDLATAGRTSVVCGQGGAIPDMVATLAAEDGAALPHFRSRKGSVWALSFRDGLLMAADYYQNFEAVFP